MVPAMQAADRRSLNSKPSFDTNVTYSLIFSELMAATVMTESEPGPSVYYLVLAIEACGREDRRRSFREHETAPSRAEKLRHRAGQHSPNLHFITISTLANTISQVLDLFAPHNEPDCGFSGVRDGMDLPLWGMSCPTAPRWHDSRT